MIKLIKIKDSYLPVEFKTPARSKSLKVLVYKNGRVLVTRPKYVSLRQAEKYLESKISWLEKCLNDLDIEPGQNVDKNIELEKKHYLKHRENARSIIEKRTAEINKYYNFKYKKISIRNQKTRWGSCSKASNLNFNYRLIFLSSPELDYVIAHELCHLKEFNHSAKFWEQVSIFCPEYKEIRKKLKTVSELYLS